MLRILIELTNRCNLSCDHCLDGRHSATGDLKVDTVGIILQSARRFGFDSLSFTGGEPTLHPRFIDIIAGVFNAGYSFGFVTNGWNFKGIYEALLSYRERLSGITFSLDGARQEIHDRLRGRGSYRRVMQAVSICMIKDIPFTFNTVLTSHNCGELKEVVELAEKLGSGGIRFGHLLHTPLSMAKNLELSPEERKEIETRIWQLKRDVSFPIFMAPGYYTNDLFPCAPLQREEFNIDWRGNVTLCCNLSGHSKGAGNRDVIGNLAEMSFPEAYERLVSLKKRFHQNKLERYNSGNFNDSDYFPCWYCLNYFKKGIIKILNFKHKEKSA